MRAFILAAGDGTRMRPLTASMPKALLPVAGKPLLQHMLETLKDCKVKDITILVNPGRRYIDQEFGDGSDLGVQLSYVVQRKPLGTANAVGTARLVLDEPFLCMNGDVIVNKETIKGVLDSFKKNGSTVVTGVPVDNPSEFGILEQKNGNLVRVVEKAKHPPGNLANAGIYLFNPDVFGWIDKTEKSVRGEYEITDTLTMMAAQEKIHCQTYDGQWVDVGRPWDMLRANKLLMEGLKAKIEGEIQPNATIEGNIVLGEGSRIMNGAYIIGPVIIGRDTEIGPNCYIRPSTFIGSECKVGNATEVKNSILMDRAKAPHHNYVGDSILGFNTNLGSGTKVANLRLDEKNIRVSLKGKLVDTGLRKLGVITGENVKVGINASIEPGTVISENCFVGAGTTVGGTISPGSRIY
ncbi:MAG: NTP transferase domain-containing protein [Candidatus Thermoplasmatota archaeon]|nr:glucose-1-phosphate thymidylyltransferase [Euryarchaeota archaeon]MBU4032676.1 NTP transferase domain-containing protein [Candidatus Thermoplasmatota archaeon]MBU4071211.1 NTP transferase domain-containing protein [Candidatus Thermoplasmatota archaeon]MBU4592778.1 NTP transferase domain-containing protein [Candidatus Thermoplasmatota archaeon]